MEYILCYSFNYNLWKEINTKKFPKKLIPQTSVITIDENILLILQKIIKYLFYH